MPILVKDKSLSIKDIVAKGVEIAKENGYINQGDIITIAGGGTVLNGFDTSDMNRTMGGVIRV